MAANNSRANRRYVTRFPLTETPISEGGNWTGGRTPGLDWADVLTIPGLARGTVSLAPFDDPTALLTGAWGPEQQVEATVYSVNPTEQCCQEVELRLRSSLSAHCCTGYEVLFRCLKTPNAYAEIVRWDGPLAKFTYLARCKGAEFGVTHGDVVRASVVGKVIKAYINGHLIASVEDNIYPAGSPGIGFNFGCGETYGDFGFTSFMATEVGHYKLGS